MTNETTTTERARTKLSDDSAKIPWRDLIGFFILGILSDALPGFFFTVTVVKDLQIPREKGMAPLQLSADVGGVVGVFFTTLVLSRFLPEVRVLVNLIFQLVGIVLAWQLRYPTNMIGITILTIGFQGLLATLLPLTVYKPGYVTNAYQFGYSVAPIFGAIIVTIGESAGITSDGLFAIATCWPIIIFLAFFLLVDRSPWREGGFWNMRVNKNSVQTKPSEDAFPSRNEAAEGSEEVASSKENESAEEAVSFHRELEKEPEEVVSDGETLDDIPDEDSETHVNEAPEVRPGKNVTGSVKFDATPLTCKNRLSAVREIALVYLPFYVVACLTHNLWGDAVQLSFLTSIVTYAGLDPEVSEDVIVLIAHVGVLLIGVSVVLPYVGAFLGHLNALFLWIPTVVQLAFVVTGTVALHGVFRPLNVGAAYAFQLVTTMAFYYVVIHAPINMRNDAKLTPRYQEFHIQTLQITLNISYLVMDIICLFWASPALFRVCQTNVEQIYTGANC